MLKKAMYFLFALSFLATFNGYADEEVAANVDVEVSSKDSNEANEVEAEVADNAGGAEQEKDKQ